MSTPASSSAASVASSLLVRPLVVLLGWWRASPRHLNKYAELYQGAGRGSWEVHSECPPTPLFISRNRSEQWCQDFSRIITSKLDSSSSADSSSPASSSAPRPARPLYLHLMSNHGAYLYAMIIHQALRPQSSSSSSSSSLSFQQRFISAVRGVVFDSAPSFPTINARTILRGYTSSWIASYHAKRFSSESGGKGGGVVPPDPSAEWRGVRIPEADPLYSIPLRSSILSELFRPFYDENWRRELAYTLALRQPVHYPQLYLYSEADPLVPSREIQDYLAVLRSSRPLGPSDPLISEYRFTSSGHVSHLYSHPQIYRAQLDSFYENIRLADQHHHPLHRADHSHLYHHQHQHQHPNPP